jgi:hypothetical protein
MSRTDRLTKWLALVALGGMLWTTGCLPENFWADKWGEILNSSIFAGINLALNAATNGTVQI